jgi:polyhydroxyalkanoate synthesis regulator phasin
MDSFNAFEKINVRALRIIIDNWDDLQVPGVWDGFDPATLKRYLDKVRGDEVPVKYAYSKEAKDHGRKYAVGGLSLQSLPRVVRHTISKDYYYDIDMINAHPSILLQYCEKNGYGCNHLKYYIDNRDKCLQEIMENNEINRDDAKQVLLSLLNGGIKDYMNLKNKPEWLNNFKTQITTIQKSISSSNDEYIQKLRKECKKQNVNGALMNRILCDIEDEILMACVDYLKSKNINIKNIVLVFDGFMVLKDLVKLDEMFFNDLGDFVEEKTGYSVKFIEKEMNEDIDLSGYTTKTEYKPVRYATNDDEASDLFLEDVKDVIKKEGSRTFMITPEHVWTEDKQDIKSQLLAMCLKANIATPVEDENGNVKEKAYSKCVTKAENIIKATLAKLPKTKDFYKTMWESTIGKLCFEDGVYDFQSRTFTKWEDVKNVYTTLIINRPFPKRDEDKIKEVHERLLDTIFTKEQKIDWLKYIARGIAGQYSDKQWAVGMGERNSGKGKLVNLCESTFSKYVNTINSENFMMERMGSGDEAKKQSWMIDCEFTRLTFSNEITIDNEDKNRKINGNMIKRFASGGDTINARKLFMNEVEFKMQSRLMIMCNDLPPIDPTDATQTLVMFKFPYKYVSEADMVDPLPYFRLADPSIDEYVKDANVCDAFIHILIDHYEDNKLKMSSKVEKDTKEYREDAGDEEMIIRDTFKYSNSKADYVTNDDIKNFIKEKKINISATALKEKLIKMNGVNEQRRVNGKAIRGIFNIKMNKDNDLDDNIDDFE